MAILQPANTDSLLPWSFLHPHLQWHGFAMPQCGVDAWRVRRCLWTLSSKWKHGTSRSGMPSIFVLNSVRIPPQYTGNFSRPLEMMQCQEYKPSAGTKNVFWRQNRCWRWVAQRTTIKTRTGGQEALVRELVRSGRRWAVKMIADELKMNRETVRLILTEELGMRKICAKIVPRNLTQQQRDARMSTCADLLEQVEADPQLMDRVITGDKSWFSQYDPETKRQSL